MDVQQTLRKRIVFTEDISNSDSVSNSAIKADKATGRRTEDLDIPQHHLTFEPRIQLNQLMYNHQGDNPIARLLR